MQRQRALHDDRGSRGPPRDAEAWYQSGLYALANAFRTDYTSGFYSAHEGAIAAFDKAIELKPDYFDAWYLKGVALATLDRYDEALLADEQALRCQPKDPETWLHKAVALSRLERYEEALTASEEVLSLWPHDVEALFRKAEALGKIGRHAEAVAVWQDVLRARPDAKAEVHCHHGVLRHLARLPPDQRPFPSRQRASEPRAPRGSQSRLSGWHRARAGGTYGHAWARGFHRGSGKIR